MQEEEKEAEGGQSVYDTIMLWIWVKVKTLFHSHKWIFYTSFFPLTLSHVHLIMPLFMLAERLHLPHEIYVTGNIKNHNDINCVFEGLTRS